MLAMSDHDRHGREPGGAAMLLIVGPPTWLAAAMFAVALCRAASHGDRTSAERARLASILNSLGSAPSLPGPSRKTPRQPRSLVRCGRGGISPTSPRPSTTSAPCRRLLVRLRTGGRAPAACRADRDGARAMENIAIVKEVFAAVATRDDVRLRHCAAARSSSRTRSAGLSATAIATKAGARSSAI